jgi:putative peptidoglycan lipid II flippase
MSRALLKSTFITGAMTLLSRISGLVRDMVFAGLIGAGGGIAADAFYVAFRIPNFLRRIFGEGAFSQAFVPVCAEYRTRGPHEAVRAFLDRMVGVFSLVLLVVTLAGVLLAPVLVWAMAPGFQGEQYDLTVTMLRITFPYLFFISLVALAAGILNTYQRFAAAAFTPVLLNLSLIGAALWLSPVMDKPVLALAWGVFIAGAVQLLFQLPMLWKIDLLPRPRLDRNHDGVGKVFRLMLPAIFGVSVAQVNVLVNTVLASFLVTGSVSWLYYSDRLMEFPLGVFGIAFATVILPSLSRHHAAAEREEFSKLLDWGLRWVLLISLPATIGLMFLAGPLLATFFHFGAFTDHDVRMSAEALIAFAFGLSAFMLVKVLAPGFYAQQNTRTPMRIGVVAMAVNIALSVMLVWPLRHTGLALAISLAAFVNAGLLFWKLRQHGVYRPEPGWLRFMGQLVLANLALAVLLAWGVGALNEWLQAAHLTRVVRLLTWVMLGAGVYLAALWLVGLRPRMLLLRAGRDTTGSDKHDA